MRPNICLICWPHISQIGQLSAEFYSELIPNKMSTRRRAQTRTKKETALESNDEIEEEIDIEENKRKSVKRYQVIIIC